MAHEGHVQPQDKNQPPLEHCYSGRVSREHAVRVKVEIVFVNPLLALCP